jgi:drug/metabolite transporter (DMT)-like permease
MGVLIVALRHAPLGMVVPLLASTNVTVALAGAWLFGERITPRRWAGVLLITVGVALVSSSFRE